MARLVESTVQRVAQDYLTNRYRKWSRNRRLFSQIEVRTKKQYGNKRADGLLAFKHWFLGTYVVSMEAKSYKTLPAIKPKFDSRHYIQNCLLSGFIICILSGAFFAFYKLDDAFMRLFIPISGFAVGTILYGIITLNDFSHKVIAVVKQIGQYPANEQWLAFSQDSLNSISDKKQKDMLRICKSRGIGVLIVQQKGRVVIKNKPKSRWNWGRDYLRFYALEKDIRKVL